MRQPRLGPSWHALERASSLNPNASGMLMEVDETTSENVDRSNLYVAGKLEGREPAEGETALADFSPDWFARFPTGPSHNPNDFEPTAAAPLFGKRAPLPDALFDRNGTARDGTADLGPIEVR